MPTIRYVVHGRVQGVGFRYFVRTAGRNLRLRGWVRNRADGAVELVAAGGADSLRLLESKLRHGPPGARVDSVSSEPVVGDGGGDGDDLSYPFIISSSA